MSRLMNVRIALIAAAAFCFGCAVRGEAQPAAPSQVIATINTNQAAPAVPKYEYGMFIEHIRTLIYRCLLYTSSLNNSADRSNSKNSPRG